MLLSILRGRQERSIVEEKRNEISDGVRLVFFDKKGKYENSKYFPET